jgi:hypothetical protein
MNKTSPNPRIMLLASTLAATLVFSNTQAHPYASAVTNVNGHVQFILNESGGSVSVLFDNQTVTNVLGTLLIGSNGFSLGTHTNFAIVVSKTGAGSLSQISVTSSNSAFYGPRGVAVNRNPQSVNFGRVYVANASAGTAGNRSVGRGIYVLNADTSDALGYYTNAQTAGITLGSSSTYSPYKVFVGPDDMVYVGDAANNLYGGYTVGTAAVTMFDPAVTVATPILNWSAGGNFGGAISTPVVTGSLAAGTLQLYCFEWGYDPNTTNNFCAMYNYPVGATAPCTAMPNIDFDPCVLDGINWVDGVGQDLCLAPDGKFFAAPFRGASAGQDCLFVYSSDAQTLLWDSLRAAGGKPASSGIDPVSSIYGVTVSPDDKFVACVHSTEGAVLLMSLTNGVPDLSTLTTNLTGMSGTARGIAFDAADNVYVTSGGNDEVEAFSLGLTTTATTYNDITGTNGTFSLYIPPNTVSVVAITNQASQSGPKAGVFKITRSAGLGLSQPLAVSFAFSGSATGGVYMCSPSGIVPLATNTIVIAANQLSTNITITPVNDNVSRPTTTVILSLLSGTNYSAVFPNQDTVNIQNTGPQFVFVSSVLSPTMYNAFSNDYCSFTVTRWGNTNASAYPVTFTSASGATAVLGVDYTTPSTITFQPGALVYTNYIYPLHNGQPPVDSSANPYVGNKLALIIPASGGYTAGTNPAALTILDSAYPTTAVLWSDPLTDPNDVTNWAMTSANNNMGNQPVDNTVEFGYDLQNGDPTDNGAIPLPPNGAATALRVTCNKTDNSPGSQGQAAGVNLYPTNVSFSGNYAVRFNMNLIQGHNYSVTTEGAMFGVNHTGYCTNWWSGSGLVTGWDPSGTNETWESDGVWYWLCADIGYEEYLEKTGLGGTLPNTGGPAGWENLNGNYVTPFLTAFNTNIFTGGTAVGSPGLVSNGSVISNLDASHWSDVEIKQLNNSVTLSIDKTVVFSYANTTAFTNGTIMLGYDDPYNSVGTADACAYYSNLRVVALAAPYISQLAANRVNNTAVINFTSTDGDTLPSSFTVVSSTSLKGPYSAASGATVTQLSAGAFQAVVPETGAVQFYRILQN